MLVYLQNQEFYLVTDNRLGILHIFPELLCLIFEAAAFARKDVICQRAVTQVVVAWQPFKDPETDVIRYMMCMNCIKYW